jgi:hypothetical protein
MRRIVVLEEAAEDIERGRKFCDLQEIGVGDFFEDTILSDTESLGLFHGIHADILDSIACYGKISVRNPEFTPAFAQLPALKAARLYQYHPRACRSCRSYSVDI